MVPVVASRSPESKLKREVLPAPFGPMMPKVSFCFTERVIPSRIFAPPIVRPRLSTVSAEVIWLIYLLPIYLSNYLSVNSGEKSVKKETRSDCYVVKSAY